jgi:CDP-glucose 4,6-dehydratase
VAQILVTGGEGFIGSAICRELLERGENVRVLDLPRPSFAGLSARGILGEVEVISGDIADGAVTSSAVAGMDRVFHLAAQTLVGPAARDPLGTFRSNVEGTWRVLEACRVAGPEAVVVASSDKAYGPSTSLPYREDQPLEPAATYEASKAATDVIARSYSSAAGVPVAVTRLANVYGGGDLNFSRIVPELMAAAVHGREPRFRSDGSPRRDFLHVSDAVTAYLILADALAEGRGRGLAVNAGTGIPTSVADVIEATGRTTGNEFGKSELAEGPPEGEIDDQFVDPSRLFDLTGWRARTDLDTGLREAFEWYRSRPDLCP